MHAHSCADAYLELRWKFAGRPVVVCKVWMHECCAELRSCLGSNLFKGHFEGVPSGRGFGVWS